MVWVSGCGGATVRAPSEPAARETPVVAETTEDAVTGALEAPSPEAVTRWLAELEQAVSTPRAAFTCFALPGDLAPFHVARCGTERGASTSVHVARRDADAIVTIGAIRIDEPIEEARISARSSTALAVGLRPLVDGAPRLELVCSAPRGRCVVLPLGAEERSTAVEARRFEVALEDTAEGTVLRLGGLPLPSSLAALAEGALLEPLLIEGEVPTVAAPPDPELVSARLFRALHPEASVRSREIVLVDDGMRRETLTLTEPREHLVAVTAMGDMPDVFEQQIILQLVDTRAAGVAILTSASCFESPSAPARGGRWPARALGAPTPLAEPEPDFLTDLPSSVREVPDAPESWQVRRGTVCHGHLCSAVVLAGDASFHATMGEILANARFAPEAVSLTRRQACEGP
jgi:hypothetical protein